MKTNFTTKLHKIALCYISAILLLISCDRSGLTPEISSGTDGNLLSLATYQELLVFRGEQTAIPFTVGISNPSKLDIRIIQGQDYSSVNLDGNRKSGILSVCFPINLDESAVPMVKLSVCYGNQSRDYSVLLRAKTVCFYARDLEFLTGEAETLPLDLTIDSNYDCGFVAESDQPWIHISENMTVSVDENDGDDPRTGSIVISDASGRTSTRVNVFQDVAPLKPVEGFVYFRDRNFKRGVLAVADSDGDREVSFEEARSIRRLELPRSGIRDITGIESMEGIQILDLSGNDIAYADFSDYAVFHDLKYINLKGNKLSKCDGVPDYPHVNVGGCYEGPSFEFLRDETTIPFSEPKYYESSVLYTGELACLQEHTRGNGLYIFLKDQYLLDHAYMNGAAEERFRKAMETIFSKEPFKSFRDCFSVFYYKISAKSTLEKGELYDDLFQRKISEYNYTLTIYTAKDLSSRIGGFNAVGITNACDYTEYYPCFKNYQVRPYVAILRDSFLTLSLLHELGHAFGNLRDEYDCGGNGTMLMNCSQTNNPELVPWKDFFKIMKYQDRVGIYPNGRYFIPSPANTSLMGHFGVEFNSPSRYAIFRTLFWCSNADLSTMNGPTEEEMWQAFLKYDIINDNIPI